MPLRRQLVAGAIVARANLTLFERPDRLPRAMLAMRPWGATLAGLVAASAARYPNTVAIVDESGATTYEELWRRSQSVAAGLVAGGVEPRSVVGLLGRNHRGFVEALIAVSAIGADVVLLNTGFAGPQLADVVADERISHVIHDEEFADVVATCDVEPFDETLLAGFASTGATVGAQRTQGRVVILTSGTTGRPKGAGRRQDPAAIEGLAAVLERVPFRLGDTQLVAAPLFHAWGLSNLLLGLGRCATNVLARIFDAESTLRSLRENQANVIVVVPVMLSRILALPGDVLDEVATPDLRVIASSGSALGSGLTTAVLDRFGPVLYNFYGSTEVAIATVATPDDLRRAPSTAGRVAFGVKVEILDDQGEPLPDGSVGRVFVGGSMRFDGYTTGGGKEERRGLLSSGDLGHFDDGLLFIDGRDDDMIVSGGENVFPIEVEELLGQHPGIQEVAVVGVPDDRFGQALVAFVVVRPGASLDHRRRSIAGPRAVGQAQSATAGDVRRRVAAQPDGKVLRRSLVDLAGEDGR